MKKMALRGGFGNKLNESPNQAQVASIDLKGVIGFWRSNEMANGQI
jgi:hypothetical protein